MSKWLPYMRISRRRAVVVPLVAVSLVAILSVVAVVIDGGLLMANRRQAQNAADAAALAAAIDLYLNYPKNKGQDASGTAVASALATASDNGVTNGQNGASVWVNIPPKTGPYRGLPGHAEVVLTTQQPRFFSAIFGNGSLPIYARAVSRGKWAPKSAGLIILDPTGSNDLTTTNQANITVVGGDIIVDSNDTKGGTISNTGNITANNIYFSGNPGYYTSGTGQFNANLWSSQVPTPDPLASLPPPPQPADTYTNVNISGLPKLGGNVPGFPTPGDPNGWTLPPGTYSGGIHISDNNPAHTYTLQSGIFYFTNGGFNLTANAGVASDPLGVMMYFHDGGGLSLTAGGPVTLTPLQTGPYANITVYEDRSNTAQDSITGQTNGTLTITGTVYLPSAKLTLTGAGASNNYAIGSQYIVYQLVVTGAGSFNIDYNGPLTPPWRDLYLVE